MYLKINIKDQGKTEEYNDELRRMGLNLLHMDDTNLVNYYDLPSDATSFSPFDLKLPGDPKLELVPDIKAMLHPGIALFKDENAYLILHLPDGALYNTPEEDDEELVIKAIIELRNLSDTEMVIHSRYSMPFQLDIREVNQDVMLTISGTELEKEQEVRIAPSQRLTADFSVTATGFKGNLVLIGKTIPVLIGDKSFIFQTSSIPLIVK